MSHPYPQQEQAIVASVIRTPEFRKIIDLPLIAWQEVAIVLAAYLTICGGIWLTMQGILPYPVLIITSGMAFYAAFTPLHDATHRAVSSNGVMNDLIGTVSAQLLAPGITAGLYRHLHLAHHRHTGDIEKDPDEALVSTHPLIRIFVLSFIDMYWFYWYLSRPQNLSAATYAKHAVSAALWLGWHVAWLTSPYANEFLVLYVVPHRVGMLMVAYLFASIQHPEGVLEYQKPFQATRMFKGGWLVRIFMISQSQHLMHHLFPMVPYYRYNAAWKLSKPALEDQGLIWAWPVGKRPMSLGVNADRHTVEVEVVGIEQITAEVSAYSFAAIAGDPLPEYMAGAHIDVHIGHDNDGQALIRQYSLTGIAPDGQYSIAVKREADGRGGSKALHSRFKLSKKITIGLPRNLFSLAADDTKAVLIAGGIGITPIISMAKALEKTNVNFDFHFCGRDAESLPFDSWLNIQTWSPQVHRWVGNNRITPQAIGPYSQGQSLYLCGPEGFMNFVEGLAIAQGWPASKIYSEKFAASSDMANNKAFTVELKRSGREFIVPPEQTLLDALQENHVTIAASCVQGLCGTCSCRVVSGEVDHRDQFYTDEEHQSGLMTSCVSRAQGDKLVLDL
jgi:ferredoxin-NADP reductase/fatty acid desaturase